MGLAEALPTGVAATGVTCTHESPALQAQAGQLGPLPALLTLCLSQMQEEVLQHGRASGHNQCSCFVSSMLMLMFTLIFVSTTFCFCVMLMSLTLYVQGLMVKCMQDYHQRLWQLQ